MSNSRTKNSLLNMFSSMGYQTLNIVLSFVNRTIFLQVLGVGYLGINGLFNDVLSMLNMAELGISTAMTYSMYKPLAENDYDTLAGLTYFYKKVYRIIACAIAGIGVCLIPFLPYIINLETPIPYVEVYYLLFLAINVSSYLVVFKTTVLYADQKNYVMLQRSAIWRIIEMPVLLLVLYITKSYVLFLVGQVVFVYSKNFYMSSLANKYYPYINKKVILPKEKTENAFKDIGSSFIYKVANVLLNGTDNTIISILISTEMVGYFSNYSMVSGKLSNLLGTIFTSFIASIGNLIAKEDEGHVYKVFETLQSFSAIISIFCASCLFLLEEDFIRIWLGEQYILGKISLVAIVFNFYFTMATKPVVTFRESAGLFRKTKFVVLWTAVINLILSIILGKKIGLAGIVLATSISKLLTSFWYEPRLLYNDFFKRSSKEYFLQMFKDFIILIVIMAATGVLTGWYNPVSWSTLVIKGIMVAGISAMMTMAFYCRSAGFKMLVDRVKNILRLH